MRFKLDWSLKRGANRLSHVLVLTHFRRLAMKKIIVTALFLSLGALAQSYEIKSKTCDTKIALETQVVNPRTRQAGEIITVKDWYVDANTPRPSMLSRAFSRQDKLDRYDGLRIILNLGYKLTPVLASRGDASTAKPGDLFLSIRTVCSADPVSYFCSPVVFLEQAKEVYPGRITFLILMEQSLYGGRLFDGPSYTAATFAAFKYATTLLPKCVLE